MCIISQQLSKVTIIKKYPIPRIDDLFDQLQRESYFSNIDLWSGYHQFRVKKKDIMKMNFQTQYGRYEFSVMSFVLDEWPTYIYEFGSVIFPKWDRVYIS